MRSSTGLGMPSRSGLMSMSATTSNMAVGTAVGATSGARLRGLREPQPARPVTTAVPRPKAPSVCSACRRPCDPCGSCDLHMASPVSMSVIGFTRADPHRQRAEVVLVRIAAGYDAADHALYPFVGALAGGQQLLHFRLVRSEEHTSELQSPCNLVCRLL